MDFRDVVADNYRNGDQLISRGGKDVLYV